ncbi:acryloyl-CoA reductase [Paenibacillus aceris]|uniref:YhdH/YhfP family quinone oxidoreductase n=1 Tax=Paenibacillus aceris TaxID=869555 RepID=A0ABS4HZG9_9BACL|nr:acryloyl-CoA reductase [Paenibacillus aceris]MBP1964030.1 putative YhdH/YhfP family quinone oxidoreductase [Paenibacillus aceris]NHW34555.1 acryloyl-CoA reductase [Paenibacillus aceris]
MEGFNALMVERTEERFSAHVKELRMEDLPPGEVTIRVRYSGINYKDALACSPNGRVVRTYPMVPGIDLAGTVAASSDPRFREGDEVLVTSYELGTGHYGGFSGYARVPADWVVPLPKGLSHREAMILGTAGFTAALSIQRMEENGLNKERGPVLVRGATGGVGSNSVSMLAALGYEVEASTGKSADHQYLLDLGATRVVPREELSPSVRKPMDKEYWAGCVDPVGGDSLAYVLSRMKYAGSVALSGLTGGGEFTATVFPFILRGVNVLGIDSVYCPAEIRSPLWERIAGELKPRLLERMVYKEVTLDGAAEAAQEVLGGKVRGRVLVSL